MKFADIVCFDAVIPELESHRRDKVILELVKSLDRCMKLGRKKREDIYKQLVKRENEASTGMGKGVALPHIKHPDVKEVIMTIGQSSKGIDFSALDEQLVYSTILLISPDNDPEKHLQVMQKIFLLLQNERFRNFLRQAQTTGEIKELFLEADDNAFI
jgi:mannitol/fructose-specific phosphotransferase system IIA component (Ntr-type)